MRILLSSFLLSTLFFISCKDDDGEIRQDSILKLDETISVDGMFRLFHIQHPLEHNNKLLVVLLHGHGGNSHSFLQSSGFK